LRGVTRIRSGFPAAIVIIKIGMQRKLQMIGKPKPLPGSWTKSYATEYKNRLRNPRWHTLAVTIVTTFS